MEVIDMMVKKRGIKSIFEEFLNEEILEKYVIIMWVFDWVLVYFKIKVCIFDSIW